MTNDKKEQIGDPSMDEKGQPSSTGPDKPKEHEPKREQFKAFGKNWLIGTLILAAFSGVGNIGNAIGIETINIKTITSPADLIMIFQHLNWQTGLFVFFTLVGVAAVTMLLVVTQAAFGKLFRLHRDSIIPDSQINEAIRKDLRKFRILPLAIWIILVGIIVLPLVGGIYVISGIEMTNASSLLGAYAGFHIVTIIMVIIGGAVVGWVTRHLKNKYNEIYDRIEPYVQRSRVL